MIIMSTATPAAALVCNAQDCVDIRKANTYMQSLRVDDFIQNEANQTEYYRYIAIKNLIFDLCVLQNLNKFKSNFPAVHVCMHYTFARNNKPNNVAFVNTACLIKDVVQDVFEIKDCNNSRKPVVRIQIPQHDILATCRTPANSVVPISRLNPQKAWFMENSTLLHMVDDDVVQLTPSTFIRDFIVSVYKTNAHVNSAISFEVKVGCTFLWCVFADPVKKELTFSMEHVYMLLFKKYLCCVKISQISEYVYGRPNYIIPPRLKRLDVEYLHVAFNKTCAFAQSNNIKHGRQRNRVDCQ